ncbi:hypothetical protein [Mesorhizobium sp. M0601]|uniref:hypothetical protein n=1 Tax=Mesorhizobium sp. M0601 TaxID=2956969 RepID=UPI00333836EE
MAAQMIALQNLLDLQSQGRESFSHVGVAGGQPYPEHRSEPGSSPIKNVKNSTQRIGIHRPVNPNAAPITEIDFNQPAGVAGNED